MNNDDRSQFGVAGNGAPADGQVPTLDTSDFPPVPNKPSDVNVVPAPAGGPPVLAGARIRVRIPLPDPDDWGARTIIVLENMTQLSSEFLEIEIIDRVDPNSGREYCEVKVESGTDSSGNKNFTSYTCATKKGIEQLKTAKDKMTKGGGDKVVVYLYIQPQTLKIVHADYGVKNK